VTTEQSVFPVDSPQAETCTATSSDTSVTAEQAGMQVVVLAGPVPIRRPTGGSIRTSDLPAPATQVFHIHQELRSPASASNDRLTNPNITFQESDLPSVEVTEDIPPQSSPRSGNALPAAGSVLSTPALPIFPPNNPGPLTPIQSLSAMSMATSSPISPAEYESRVRLRVSSLAFPTGTGVHTGPSDAIPVSSEQSSSAPQPEPGRSPPTTPLTGSAKKHSSSIRRLPEKGVRRSSRLHPPAVTSGSPTRTEAQTPPVDSEDALPTPSQQPLVTPQYPPDFDPPRTPRPGSRKRRASSTELYRGRSVRRSLLSVPTATPPASTSATEDLSTPDNESGVQSDQSEVSGLRHSAPESPREHQAGPALSCDSFSEASKKRPHEEISSRSSKMEPFPMFIMDKDWITSNPVAIAIDGDGFYVSADTPNLGPKALREAFLKDLETYMYSHISHEIRYTNCFHSLLQQVLVQDPIMYLIALAGMKVKNHRLISLPVAPLCFESDTDSELMDATFPFAKFITNEREVPAITILYSIEDVNIRIAPGSVSKEEVEDWWKSSGGDLKVAANKLQLGEFTTAEIRAGHAIAFPPQKPWYVEATPTAVGERYLFELKYISLIQGPKLDYSYWPDGTYERISQDNRDLTRPQVTGWGEPLNSQGRRTRFPTAMEVRGVWAIGDALLGLTSWDSPLVQRDLERLFEAGDGEWYNQEFVYSVHCQMQAKMHSLLEDFEFVHGETYGK